MNGNKVKERKYRSLKREWPHRMKDLNCGKRQKHKLIVNIFGYKVQ
jgi:hypothetical protein